MGTITRTDSLSADVSSHDTSHYSYASVSSSYPISNAYHGSSNTSYGQVSWKTGSGAETYVYLRFNLSAIPENATITSVSASAKGYVNTTSSSRVSTRQMQLASGTTLKGSALTLSTSTTAQTFSNTGSWTRAELQSAGVRFYVKRGTSNTSSTYNLRMYGATITVNYTWEETTYTITVSNDTSVNVEADPSDVVRGEDCEIKADSISGITIKDNGTDITSNFIAKQEAGYSYSISDRSTQYGFAVNSNGYYESNNKGVSRTAAVCRVNFYVPVEATITFTFINYAEQGYDFGVFGNIDTALNTNYYSAGSSGATISDTSYKLACNTSTYNSSSTHTLSYTMSSGEHYIDVKYSKDDASDSYNDSLQFKVAVSLNEPFTPRTYYSYTIENVQGDHVVLVTYSGGNVEQIYVKINGVWASFSEVYLKQNGSWVKQNDLANLFSSSTNYVKGD